MHQSNLQLSLALPEIIQAVSLIFVLDCLQRRVTTLITLFRNMPFSPRLLFRFILCVRFGSGRGDLSWVWGSIRPILSQRFGLSALVRCVIIKRLHTRRHIQRTNPIYWRVEPFCLRGMEKVYCCCGTAIARSLSYALLLAVLIDFGGGVLHGIVRFNLSIIASLNGTIHGEKHFLSVLKLRPHRVRLLRVNIIEIFNGFLGCCVNIINLITHTRIIRKGLRHKLILWHRVAVFIHVWNLALTRTIRRGWLYWFHVVILSSTRQGLSRFMGLLRWWSAVLPVVRRILLFEARALCGSTLLFVDVFYLLVHEELQMEAVVRH